MRAAFAVCSRIEVVAERALYVGACNARAMRGGALLLLVSVLGMACGGEPAVSPRDEDQPAVSPRDEEQPQMSPRDEETPLAPWNWIWKLQPRSQEAARRETPPELLNWKPLPGSPVAPVPGGVVVGEDWVSSRTGRPVSSDELGDTDEDLEAAVAEACGDGPIPPELTIRFGEGSADPDDRDPMRIRARMEQGISPDGRVDVRPRIHNERRALTDYTDIGYLALGRLDESSLRREWCEATRLIARTPLFLPRRCDWEASSSHAALRVRWGDRAFVRRGSTSNCSWMSDLQRAESGFESRVVGTPWLLHEHINFREWVNLACDIPRTDFEVVLAVGADGRARVVREHNVPRALSRCIAGVAYAVPNAEKLLLYFTARGFSLDRLEMLFLWEDGETHVFHRPGPFRCGVVGTM